jgi:hypothetical protein
MGVDAVFGAAAYGGRPDCGRNKGTVMRRGYCGLVGAGLVTILSVMAHGEDAISSGDLEREQLARAIAVLRLQPDAAGQSCLDALREVHKTEGQVKELQTRTRSADLGLARDVLETDYENGKEICGADAIRVCAGPMQPARLAAACRTLQQGGRGG